MLGDLIPWASPGVKPNRTWVYAVDDRTLRRRWERLLDARLEDKSLLFKETRDRTVQSRVVPLYQHVARAEPIAECNDLTPEVTKIAYRSFDRQWLVLDARVIDRIRPELWWSVGSNQIFASELHTAPIASGPAITFSALVPDMHNYRGNLGGRVLPLFRDSDGKTPNLAPGLLTCLSEHFQQRMTAEDVWAYVAAVVAHSGFSVRFREELSTPGIHVPMTKDKLLWNEAVEVGRRVLWLHTYGERFVNPPLNRPQGPPRMADPVRPRVVRAIPFTPDDMPNEIEYDEASRTLNVGAGQVAPVPPAVWHYDVGGMRVVRKWFSYRRREPHVRRSSDLNDVKPAAWDAEFTTDLLQVLNVLGLLVDLEPDQADVLKRVCAGPLITVQQLEGRGVIPVPRAARRPPSRPAPGQQDLRL